MNFGVRDSHENDTDEVIATYNVYASSLLQHQLHIFQFPLRRKMRPYEADDVRLFSTDGVVHAENEAPPLSSAPAGTNAAATATEPPASSRLLHFSSRLTMHCRIDTFGSSSFEAPSQQQQQPQQQQQRAHSYHYALQSHPFQPHCDYAVGFIVDGAIHLTPVATIQQFTPIIKPVEINAAHRVAEAFVSTPSTPIVPGLAISDCIHRELLRQRSVVLNADAASAKELQHFPISSVESRAMRRRLWSPAYEMSSFARGASHQRPVCRAEDSLFPPELLILGGVSGGEDAVAARGLLRRYADRHSVLEQVLVLVQRAQVVTLPELRELVTPPDPAFFASPAAPQQRPRDRVTDEELLEALRESAVWIHGVWVSKTAPRFKSTAAALREVVLLYFFESPDGFLFRRELNKLVSSVVLQRTIKEILESVAVLNSDELDPTKRVWRLKHVPVDAVARAEMIRTAEETHPQEITFQRMQWVKLKPYIMAHLSAINAGQPVTRLHLAGQRQNGGGSDVANTSSAAAAAGAVPASFKDEQLAPIVAYIRRLFLEHGVLNKQRAKELVMKGKQQNYPEATNSMLSAALQRSVQPFTSSTWVLKTLDDPAVDLCRPLILETALELVNFEARAFNTSLEEKRQRRFAGDGGNKVSSEEMQKAVPRVLAEVAVYKQHERLWHLKSGNVIAE